MKVLLRLALVAAIVVSAYYSIVEIAGQKADTAAGGGTFRVDREHAEEMGTFGSLLGELHRWGEPALAESLARLQAQGHLWVAPHLVGERSAIYVNALGLVSRIYMRRGELLARDLPFPDLDIPDATKRTFTTLRLAGTLYHELQHYEGLEDEGATYDREIAWYQHLRETIPDELADDEKRSFEWAVESALASAVAAREKAVGSATTTSGLH